MTDNNNSNSNASNSEATGNKPANPAELVISTGVQVSLNTELNTDDLVGVAVQETEDRLLEERVEVEELIRQRSRVCAKDEETLRKLNTEAVDNYKADQSTLELCAALEKFTGKPHSVYTYAATCVIEDQVTTFKAVVEIDKKEDANVKYDRYRSVVEKEVSIPFSDEIKEQIEAGEKGRVALDEANAEKNKIGQQLSDLPRMRRRAKNKIVKALMRGEISTTKDALDAVQSAQVKALPAPRSY